ncbi:polysaccharide deacetylase family protein [Streptomyces actinomycinicus]|uniref:Polysaccharide deacetylase family protein n=1 Tax=Streptomyces actinomycinicus TaxID=1695166 RepID=A0A937EQI7_9ACTN|nr:polysaccharide deacetylase family protein [Streptomyces actinomycinicus]MBL1086687.1 polysaccharide deacetylase family protein [Streptomyces actinomycinicus]
MVRVTTTNRRGVLRAGAGVVAGGALTAGCGTGQAAAPRATPTPTTTPAPVPASPSARPSSAPVPRAYPGLPVHITHGPRTRAQVALTFHGQGDPALARTLLTTAERHGARLTVLAVGSWLDTHPDLARRILDGGHDLGNHTQRHVSVNAMSEADARREITDCAERLQRLTGSIGTWFRPSRTATATPLVARLARTAGYPHVLSYEVDSLDYTRPGAAAVTRKVLADVRNGSVVSLHFGYADTVTALPDVLNELGRRGMRAVTTTELLS